MPLISNRYGKGRVRTLRLVRGMPRHSVSELTMLVMLEGGFEAAYLEGDNSAVVATDTIKNIVNVLAHRNPGADTETFARLVAAFFLDRYPQVEKADVMASETRWARLEIGGKPHDHAFTLDGNGLPFAHVVVGRDGTAAESGLAGFTFMKTTEAGWTGFHSDEYRTLADTQDRIVATAMDATWTWDRAPADHPAANARIIEAALAEFVGSYSHGVQDSMYRMGEAALAAVPEIGRIRFAMPNKHYLPMNLSAFGIAETGTVFLPTDEPHGQIEAVIARG